MLFRSNGGGAWVAGSIAFKDASLVFWNRAGRTAQSPWKSSYGFAGYGGALFLEGSMSMTGSAQITLNIAQSRAGGIWWSNKAANGTYCNAPFTFDNQAKISGFDCDSGSAKS